MYYHDNTRSEKRRQSMTRDESIALSVTLGKEYEQLKKLEDNIVDLDRRVAIPADTDRTL